MPVIKNEIGAAVRQRLEDISDIKTLSEASDARSKEAKTQSDSALKQSEITQKQLDEAVKSGTPIEEVQQAHVDGSGNVYSTLVERLNNKDTDLEQVIHDVGSLTDIPWLPESVVQAVIDLKNYQNSRAILATAPPYNVKQNSTEDQTSAIQKIIDDIDSLSIVNDGRGQVIYFPSGFYNIDLGVIIKKSNIAVAGNSMRGTEFRTNLDDGHAIFTVDSGTGDKLTNVNFRDFKINGQLKDVIGIKMKDVMVGRYYDIMVDKCANIAWSFEEVYDCNFVGVFIRDSGVTAGNIPATYIYNGSRDNSNRLVFIACTWEGNYGSNIVSDSSGNSRKNGQNKFIACKFHGRSSDDLSAAPAVPSIILDAELTYMDDCMFFQTNANMVEVKGDLNIFSNMQMHNCSGAFFSITGNYNEVRASVRNNKSGIAPVIINSGYRNRIELTGFGWGLGTISDKGQQTIFEKNDTGYYIESMSLYLNMKTSRIIKQGGFSIGNNNGRFGIWNNIYRDDSGNVRQIDGTKPGFMANVTTIAEEGFVVQGANASGTNEGIVTLTDLLRVTTASVDARKPLKLTPLSLGSEIPANSFFVDVQDKRLKFKNNAGEVLFVSLTTN